MTTATTIKVRLQVRQDTAANWTGINPVLLAGELGRETDTGKIKIGNGSTTWSGLSYQPFGGQITNADISATAEIAVSKLADGAARQLLQTAANGTDVEWTSNVDVPGTLDVTGAATFDSSVTITGDLTVNGTTTNINTTNLVVEDKNVILGDVATPTDVTADGGGITLKGATDKTITWSDTTDSWEFNQPTITTGTATAAALIPSGSTVPTNGVYLPSANNVAISTNGTGRLFVDSSGNVGVGSGTPAKNLEVSASTSATIRLNSSSTALAQNAVVGAIEYYANDASAAGTGIAASIDAIATAPFGQGGALRFSTRTDSSANAIERMRLDDAGRVGIGSTSPSELLHVNGNVLIGTGNKIRTDSSSGGLTIQGGATFPGGHIVFSGGNASDNIVFNRSGASSTSIETARIDASGRLLVGTSSGQGNSLLQVQGDASSASAEGVLYLRRGLATAAIGANVGADLGRIQFGANDGTVAANIRCISDGTWGSTSDTPGALTFSTTADGASSPTERCRVTSAGIFLVGRTGPDGSALIQAPVASGVPAYSSAAGTTSSITHFEFRNPNATVGTISTSGSSTSYTTSSDYRLKENVVPLTSAADRLNQLQVHRFNFITDPDKTVDGFIAHEAQAVVPECVTGEKDAVDADGNPVYQGIDQSKLVPLLTAALQEALAEIESLKVRVIALEP